MSTEVMQAGIIIMAIIFILAGIAAVVTEWVMRYRQNKRIHRRLYETGYRYSTRDFK